MTEEHRLPVGLAPIALSSGAGWTQAPTTEETRRDVLTLARLVERQGWEALDDGQAVDAALREAGAEGLADLDRRDACARASARSADLRKPPNAQCQAVGCGVELGDPQDGPDLCRACLGQIRVQNAARK